VGNPTGGPRDTIPPKLVTANPPNRTVNFKGNRITFTYDEYVQLVKIQDNLLINPTPKITPNIDSKLKIITVRIRDTLRPNTTYRIDFGNAVADINEGNALKNFTYLFSTGSYIDSLTCAGNVTIAETGKPDSTLLVMLYKDLDDSAVLKHKPAFTSRLDSAGNFVFYNLPGGKFNIFAIKDESGQKMYSNEEMIFAFFDSAIYISDTTHRVQLYAYQQVKPKPKGSSSNAKSTSASDKKLKFTSSIPAEHQDLLSPVLLEFNRPLKNFDSLKITLTDTLFNPISGVTVSLDTTGKRLSVQSNWLENTDYRLIIDKDFATDTLGVGWTKSDTVSFKTKKEADYGSISITFKNLEKFNNPVLEFVLSNVVVQSYPLTTAQWTAKFFKPGDYELRILEDTNNNGVWDPGNYQLKLQPEKVYSIPKKINIRADWSNEKDIVL